MPISATIGIALAPRDDVTLDHLAARPDTALYRAKDKGREASYLRASRCHLARRQRQRELRNSDFHNSSKCIGLFNGQPDGGRQVRKPWKTIPTAFRAIPGVE
jgi:hypothetical protein